MGREIKRVALDFDYPINQMIWKGYHNPYLGLECTSCNGSGHSPEYKKLSDDWYGFERPSEKWSNKIDQSEVEALIEGGRLIEFTHGWVSGYGWVKKDPEYIPTYQEVNDWSEKGLGHDSINQRICVKARLKSRGMTDHTCDVCHGEGELWPDDKYKTLCENFEPVDPPSGEGYQLWSTTTEGTPMSPVFDEPEKLAKWLFDNDASSFGHETSSYDQWLVFVKDQRWVPSAIYRSGEITSGVNAKSF